MRVGLAILRLSAAIIGSHLVLLACSPVQANHNTRYFATERDSGKTIQLHRGDELSLNLPLSGGSDWTAFSSDAKVAKPATTAVITFSSGQKSRLFNLALVGAGHAVIVACPSVTQDCSESSPGALLFNVRVD